MTVEWGGSDNQEENCKIGRAIGLDSDGVMYFEEGEFLNEGTCMDGYGRRFDGFWLEIGKFESHMLMDGIKMLSNKWKKMISSRS